MPMLVIMDKSVSVFSSMTPIELYITLELKRIDKRNNLLSFYLLISVE
jgi:hypothetical protein